jgi:pimeloyl-ACP methyl ester carboxylesterase
MIHASQSIPVGAPDIKGLAMSDPETHEISHGKALIEPGLSLHYVSAGRGDRVIVLLHGFPQTWHEWRHLIPSFVEAGYRVVAPDYRGAGHSSRPLAGYDKRGPWR